MFYPKQLPRWEERPLEVRYFFNPLILLNLILNLIRIYKKKYEKGVPFFVPFGIIPFFVYDDLYVSLPRANTTLFTAWLSENNIKYIFPKRYEILYPYIQEALLLGFSQGLIYMTDIYIDSNNEFKDDKLDTKLKICSLWFTPEKYKEALKAMGVRYEFPN